MTDISDLREMKPRITVFGVGGAGGNAINDMITAGLQGVEFVVANTDAQALTMSKAARIIQMGIQVTQGLGAGSQPEVGRAAAEEVIDEIRDHLSSAHMVFVTAGMGGGTGTGAAAVIAKAAQELGILTIGVVTKPFHFEGQRRMRLAEAGIVELQKVVDTLLVIPNQNLFRVANEKTTFSDAFAMADRVLYSGVACVTDLIVKEGLINLDFADVRAVMREKGKAMMGMGEASGEKRVLTAAKTAISNPLIEDPSVKRASGLLISITGGKDLTLFEVDEAASRIRDEADQDANIIVGAIFDDSLEGIVRVSVVATGIDNTGMTSRDGSLTNLAEELRNDGNRTADRSQQDSSFWPMPITPSSLGLPQAGPLIASTAAPERMSRAPRVPRIDDLPLPARNEIRAAQRREREGGHPDKRGKTLMHGFGRSQSDGA
jgi:cell division protein FtsZ